MVTVLRIYKSVIRERGLSIYSVWQLRRRIIKARVVQPAMPSRTRVSVSIESSLLAGFDELSRSIGHTNRSKAVGEAMREFVSGRKWEIAKKGEIPGVILLTYDHHARGVNKALTELQHEYNDILSATMHIHLSKHTCLEVIAFRGSASRVRLLAKMLQSQRGVLDLKLISSPA